MLITHPQPTETGMLSSTEAGTSSLAVLPPALVAALREPALLIAAAEWTLARDLLAVPVPVLPLEHDAEEGLMVHIDGQRIPLPALPPLCLAAIAFTDEGAEALQAAIEASTGGDAGPVVTRMEPGDAMGLAIAVVSGSTALLRRQATVLTNSLRSLGQMRIAHEDHQHRLAALEAFVARDNRQDFDLAFAEEPTSDEDCALRIGVDANLRRLTQLLPVASRGVSAIALHLASTPFSTEAIATIRLTSLEDGIERAAWRVRGQDMAPGWQVLGLDRAITGLSRTLSLSVEVTGGTFALSLGGHQPLPAFRVGGEDPGSLAPRSLAFKVWTGLPGVMPPVNAIDHLSGGDAGQGFEDVVVAAEAIELTRDGATTTRQAFDDDSLPCDPAREGITIGRLPGALPAGTMLAQGLGRVLGGAEGVEFALAAAASAEAALALAQGVMPEAGWSGWVESGADGTAALHLFLAAGEAGARDLFVLTRRLGAGRGTPPRARLGGLRATVAAAQAIGVRATPTETGAAFDDEAEPAEMLVAARDFRGTGFHSLEGAGENAWRWLGADVTLRLAQLPRQARRIEVMIAATIPGLADGSLTCAVNGVPTAASFAGTATGGTVALIPIPPAARRRDRAVTLDLSFGRAQQPPGDSRVLSVACTGLRITG